MAAFSGGGQIRSSGDCPSGLMGCQQTCLQRQRLFGTPCAAEAAGTEFIEQLEFAYAPPQGVKLVVNSEGDDTVCPQAGHSRWPSAGSVASSRAWWHSGQVKLMGNPQRGIADYHGRDSSRRQG
jgi:hypothetical protein